MSRRPLIVLLAAIVFAALTARLGWWQLDRATQKVALHEADQRQRQLPPLPAAELALDPATAATQHHRQVSLQGRWMTRHTVFLDNRPMNGRTGFVVVTPLLLADGSAVAVQRGWQPRDALDRSRVVIPPTTDGDEVIVQGRIAPPVSRLYEFAADAIGAIRQNIDPEGFSREIGRTLRPVSILQEDGPGTSGDGLVRQWLRPGADVHKHYGYAFQWFALSALIIGLYAWFQIIRPRRRQRA